MKKHQRGMVILPMIIIVALLLVVGFLFYRNFQSAKQQAQINQARSDQALATVTPPPIADESVVFVTPAVYERSFEYMNFSVGHPEGWTLFDMSTDDAFPLKERLSLYKSGKVVALIKEGVYLVIAIEKETKGGAGGIFLDDKHYNDFISNRDKVMIGNTAFYLSRTHSATGSLQESHGGPYEWSSLTEFIPRKSTPTGIYRGFEDIIKRNGYAYNFIVVSENGGNTPSHLQDEIISALETIDW